MMSTLFQPITIGNFSVRNRFVRSATQDWLGHSDGSISDEEISLYRSLAAGGVGLIITAHSYVVHPVGRASIRQNGIYDDRFIPGYSRLVDAVHAEGSAIVLQIAHAGRQTSPELTEGETALSPSAVTDSVSGITPRAMTEEEIWQTIDAFAAAISRAKHSGCDGAQLHIAHGYLLSQFISPYTNRREDTWGGSLENRTRILREIIARGRRAVGNNYPILAKLNSTDGFQGDGYLTQADVVATAKTLEAAGVAAIEISGGIREAKGVMSPPGINRPEQEACFAGTARAVKEAVSIPIILVGALRSLSVMKEVVGSGAADMVAMSRPFIKEPDLVNRFQSGQEKVTCVSCNACFNPAGLRCYLEKK